MTVISFQEAKKLMGNKERKEKPSKEVFCQAFSTENFRQLKRMFSEYMSMNGETIQEGIKVNKLFIDISQRSLMYLGICSLFLKMFFFFLQSI